MGRVIAVCNVKGGIGKTTTVVNLGAGLALKGARVLLVDVDAQGNLAMALGVQARRTLYDLMVDGVKATDCVTPARPNLDLIVSDQTLLSAQPIIGQRPGWSRTLEIGLRPLAAHYDFVMLDCGGSLTVLNANALVCASDVIVPTAVEHFSLRGIELLFDTVRKLKGSHSSIRMIVPTMYDPRRKQSIELLAELQRCYGALVGQPIRVNVRLSEAPACQQTIYEYDPRSRGALDYALLVERVSEMFGFQGPLPTIKAPIASDDTSSVVSISPNTERASTTGPGPNGKAMPHRCPHCNRLLQHATLAGYRVAYCDHCRYKTQTLIQMPRP